MSDLSALITKGVFTVQPWQRALFRVPFWERCGRFRNNLVGCGGTLCNHADVRSRWMRFSIGAMLLTPLQIPAKGENRVPDEVRYNSGYLNSLPKRADFNSAMLWGIAIADTRVPGYENAAVELARVRLSCRVDGKDVVLNDDRGGVRGGLYRRFPWFGTDEHEPMPIKAGSRTVTLRVGGRPDRVWHFWAASPRAAITPSHFEGCTVRVRARISRGALLQVGFDYWRNPTIDYGPGGNNHEAGASRWYFPSDKWQEATFSDIKK